MDWGRADLGLRRRRARASAPDARYREAGIAMRDQLDVVTAVVERLGRTGKVGFSGPEYQRAKEAC